MRHLLAFLLIAVPASAQCPDPMRVLYDFASPDAAADWLTVNDGVMGGRSEGGFAVSGDTLVFEGVLNTRGGGFSSVRARPAPLGLGGAEGLAVRYRADGRRYEVAVRTGERAGSIPVSFRAALPPAEGAEWTEACVPWSAFRASAHGRSLPERTLDPTRIRALGLFIGDGVDGPFRLVVDAIWVYGAE